MIPNVIVHAQKDFRLVNKRNLIICIFASFFVPILFVYFLNSTIFETISFVGISSEVDVKDQILYSYMISFLVFYGYQIIDNVDQKNVIKALIGSNISLKYYLLGRFFSCLLWTAFILIVFILLPTLTSFSINNYYLILVTNLILCYTFYFLSYIFFTDKIRVWFITLIITGSLYTTAYFDYIFVLYFAIFLLILLIVIFTFYFNFFYLKKIQKQYITEYNNNSFAVEHSIILNSITDYFKIPLSKLNSYNPSVLSNSLFIVDLHDVSLLMLTSFYLFILKSFYLDSYIFINVINMLFFIRVLNITFSSFKSSTKVIYNSDIKYFNLCLTKLINSLFVLSIISVPYFSIDGTFTFSISIFMIMYVLFYFSYSVYFKLKYLD